jgi:hypothetical protein
MPPMLSLDDFDDLAELDDLSLYELGLALPEGEAAESYMSLAAMVIANGNPLPLDLQAALAERGVILDEFETFIRNTIESETIH